MATQMTQATTNRSVVKVVEAHRQEEGAGFVVRRPLPSMGLPLLDPFLLVDEMAEVTYGPGEAQGAPDHPHRGFETVSYIIKGEVEHEDSAGHQGRIGPGDVQWMTAGRGVIHSEMPSRRIQRDGGTVHGFQIWVNLPARDKLMAPRYQEVPAASIPTGTSADGLATARVVAGEALGVKAVIDTRTPILFHDWLLSPGASVVQPVPKDFNVLAYVFAGEAVIGGVPVKEGEAAVFGAGDAVALGAATEAKGPARLLLLGGVPLREPVARYGPFVMNTEAEIHQAIRDFQAGRMGAIER